MRVMYPPRGRATATTRAQKIRSWIQPSKVIVPSSEALRAQQRIGEIDEEERGDGTCKRVVEDPGEILRAVRTGSHSLRQERKRRGQIEREPSRAWMFSRTSRQDETRPRSVWWIYKM